MLYVDWVLSVLPYFYLCSLSVTWLPIHLTFPWCSGAYYSASGSHSLFVQSCHVMVSILYFFPLFFALIAKFLCLRFSFLHGVCSDFLTKSYDIGGVVSVMALSGLFILMTKYGLEYPNFYEKLYALLIPSIFMAKHRAKFFEVRLGTLWNFIL